MVTFLAWASEPKMEERKRIGFGVMIFLVVFSGLLCLLPIARSGPTCTDVTACIGRALPQPRTNCAR